MEYLLIALVFGSGYVLGGSQQSPQPPVACPPVERPTVPKELLEPLELEYLLPPELRRSVRLKGAS